LIEVEVQNETYQSQERLRFAAVRLRDADGFWASYDVVDLWYQKAEYGDVWVPYLHVRITPGERAGANENDPMPAAEAAAQEAYPFTI